MSYILYYSMSSMFHLHKIDFSNEEIKKQIMLFVIKYRFYCEDVYTNLYFKMPTSSLTKLGLSKELAKEYSAQRCYDIFHDKTTDGVYITDENKNIIGFTLFDFQEQRLSGDILFVLVDPSHQYNGYGTLMVQYAINNLKNLGLAVIHVKADSDCVEWYKNKFNFRVNREDINTNPHINCVNMLLITDIVKYNNAMYYNLRANISTKNIIRKQYKNV